MSYINTIDLGSHSIIENRDLNDNIPYRTVDVNWTDGSFLATYPVGDIVYHYPQNPNNSLYVTQTIDNLKGYEALSLPLDAKFDHIRGKIWIADAGRSRAVCVTTNDYEVIIVIENLTVPFAVLPDINNGGCFIYSFINISNGCITHVDSQGNELGKFTFTRTFPAGNTITLYKTKEFVDLMPSTHSMAYDYSRSKIWWLGDTDVYMADTFSQTISQYEMQQHGFSSLSTITVEKKTGNAFIVATSNHNDYVAQILEGNRKYMGSTWIGNYGPPITINSSSSSSSSESSSSS